MLSCSCDMIAAVTKSDASVSSMIGNAGSKCLRIGAVCHEPSRTRLEPNTRCGSEPGSRVEPIGLDL